MSVSIIPEERSANIQFSNDEIARYSRHLIMPEVTLEGQKRLKAASILCIGSGGRGAPTPPSLSSGGIRPPRGFTWRPHGFSNLPRPLLPPPQKSGRPKTKTPPPRPPPRD